MLVNGSQSQGDTQKLSPSVYEYYSKESREARAAQELRLLTHTPLGTQDSASHTLQEGETGHIDLLAVYEQSSIDRAEDLPIDDEEDDIDPLSQDVRADIFPEARRFQPPKTPASQGRKRKRGIETPSQGQPTPKLPVNPFASQMGSIDGLMGASQLFQTTQAQTSPMTNLVPSDGLSDRPSPDLHYRRPSTAAPISSPLRAPRSSIVRAVTEPQTTYTTMKESQEARERQKQAKKAEQALLSDELSDEEFSEDTQLRRRLRQQRYLDEAKGQFAYISRRSAATLHVQNTDLDGGIAITPSRSSPRKKGRQVSEPVLISDDLPGEDGQGSITEDETEREESPEPQKDEEIDELADDNKENVEVPRSVSRIQHTTSQVISSQPTPSHARIQKGNVPSQTRKATLVESSSQPTSSRQTRQAESDTQPEAIADSQTSQYNHKIGQNVQPPVTRALSEPRSSKDARILVPHSQSSNPPTAVKPLPKTFEQQLYNSTSQAASTSSQQDKIPTSKISSVPSDAQNGGVVVGANVRSTNTDNSSEVRSRLEGTLGSQNKAVGSPGPTLKVFANTVPNTENSTEGIGSSDVAVPDSSSMMPSPRTTPKKSVSTNTATLQSRGSTLFETAPEHTTNTLQNCQSKSLSPPKPRKPRTISEIAAEPSPADGNGEIDIDIDIDILSNEDKEFQKVMNGSSPVAPSRKRRRGAHGSAVQPTEPWPNVLPQLHGTPMPPPSSAISAITPVPSSPPSHSKSLAAMKMVVTGVIAEGSNPPSSESKGEPDLDRAPAPPSAPPPTKDTEGDSAATGDVPRFSKRNVPKPAAIKAQGSTGDALVPDANPNSTNPSPIVAPNRVFAHFNGGNPAYYPATCLEIIGGEEPRYRVRFDDGTVDVISAYGIKRLELKAGDVIKVDISGARTKNYTVESMRDQQRSATAPDPATPSRRGHEPSTSVSAFPEIDIHGYATVIASPKQRVSTDGNQAESEQITVPLTQVYLTQTQWTAYRNRQYTHVANSMTSFTGLRTPSDRPSTPSSPASRTRRLKTSGLTQARSMAGGDRAGGGLFKNMVFAITNVDRIEDSRRVKQRILSNSGVILDGGFDELFNIPALIRTTSPISPKETWDHTFHLTSQAQDVGFACLIADKHCRRAKFIQALALGIPCLATRWISDCVAKQRIVPWAPYLLPSGESAFLGGAVRSRNLQPFSAESATLADIVANRSKLLRGASVLLIMEKSQEEIMKQHPLITHALGASKVSRAINEAAAVKAVTDAQAAGEPWDWVFSYDKEKDVEKRLHGGSSTAKKRKRGRESEIPETSLKGTKTRVVGNEFVIQSLILGILVDG